MLEGAYVAGQPTSDGLEEGDINGPFFVKKPVGTYFSWRCMLLGTDGLLLAEKGLLARLCR